MSREAGRARPAWLASLAIHALLVAVVAAWLNMHLTPAPLPERPQPLQLAMFEPAPPAPPTPPEPVETHAATLPEPLAPPPVVESPKPAPVPRPAPAKKPPAPSVKPESKPEVDSAAIEPVSPVPVPAPVPVEHREPPPTPSTAAHPDPRLEESYRARVRQAVDERKHYPRMARRLELEGRVVVAFTVGAEGRLADLRLVESSGSELLDEAALEAVRQAAPFPPFPAGIERRQWDFILPLSFALER